MHFRPLTNSPGYYSTDQNNPASDESIPEAIETTEVVDDLLNRSPFNLNVKGTPTRLEHKMQSSLTLADPLSQGQFVADSGFVNVNDLEVKSCSGDSMDEFVSVKASPCSNASEGFAPTEADILCAKNDRVDM